MARGTMWASEPRCEGWAKAWAMVRRSRSKNAQEKSPRVLMLVEYAARRRVAPISSVMASSAFRITSKRTGSMSPPSVRADAVVGGVMLAPSGRYAYVDRERTSPSSDRGRMLPAWQPGRGRVAEDRNRAAGAERHAQETRTMRDRQIAIVGYSETKIELRSGRHVFDLAGEAMARVIEQTGIEKSVIDGLALSSSFSD